MDDYVSLRLRARFADADQRRIFANEAVIRDKLSLAIL